MSIFDGKKPGFVYVATANELLINDICKIGISTNVRSRLNSHQKNSSMPYELFCFACFRFDAVDEARLVETWVKRELRKLKRQYGEKAEFFNICPAKMCDAIREGIEKCKLSAIEEFPSDLEQILQKGGDFYSLPEELLECLTSNEAKTYWQGVRDTLLVLSRLPGIEIMREDFSYLCNSIDFNTKFNAPSVAATLTLHFRNHHNERFRKVGERANKETAQFELDGFSVLPGDWQIPDWRKETST